MPKDYTNKQLVLPWWLCGKDAGDVTEWVPFLGQEDPLEEGMAIHSSIHA